MTTWGMLIDLKRCAGCGACVVACQLQNNQGPGVSWVKLDTVEWGEAAGEAGRAYLPHACMHCENPECVSVCPTGASQKLDDGVVIVDYDACITCGYCMSACPYGARVLNEGKGNYFGEYAQAPYEAYGVQRSRVVEKCIFCRERAEEGLPVACVLNCPAHARFFGDLDDPESDVSKEMLFSAEDMTDFLNKADFIQNISDYDRKMLTELQETKNQIAEEEKTLQAQQDSLVSLQTSLDKKQSDLEAKAAATSTDLATFQAQLAALRAQEAAELEAKRQQELQQQQQQEQQQESDKPSSGDGNSTVTPTPPTTPDSGGDIIQGGGSDATHDELTTFAALLDCEAIHDYNSMLAVATVIMNRVESPLFPNSIHGVIYATGQFEPVWSGRLDSVLNSGPSSLALQVAQDAVNGARLSSVIDCYFFLYAGGTDRPGVNVGGNLFFQSW